MKMPIDSVRDAINWDCLTTQQFTLINSYLPDLEMLDHVSYSDPLPSAEEVKEFIEKQVEINLPAQHIMHKLPQRVAITRSAILGASLICYSPAAATLMAYELTRMYDEEGKDLLLLEDVYKSLLQRGTPTPEEWARLWHNQKCPEDGETNLLESSVVWDKE